MLAGLRDKTFALQEGLFNSQQSTMSNYQPAASYFLLHAALPSRLLTWFYMLGKPQRSPRALLLPTSYSLLPTSYYMRRCLRAFLRGSTCWGNPSVAHALCYFLLPTSYSLLPTSYYMRRCLRAFVTSYFLLKKLSTISYLITHSHILKAIDG